MIEIAVNKDKTVLHLVIDGKICEEENPTSVLPVKLSGSGDGVGLFISSRSSETLERLLQHRFSEFPPDPWTLELHWYDAVTQRLVAIDNMILHALTIYRTNEGHFYLGFSNHFDSQNWKQPWSVSEYEFAFEEIVKTQGISSELPTTERVAVFPYTDQTPKVVLDVSGSELTVEEEVLDQRSLIIKLHDLTRFYLQLRLKADSVVVRFEFPEAARTACEQYLLLPKLPNTRVKAST